MPKPLLAQLIEMRAAEHPDRTFLKMRDVTVSWGEFDANVVRTARGYHDAGLRPSDRIAVMLPNSPEFLCAHFGAVSGGFVPVPVNTAQRGDTLAYLLHDCEARAIVIHSSLWERYEEVRPGLREFVVGEPRVPEAVRFDDVLAGPRVEPPDPGEAGGAFGVLYTSGTTGPPKGVVPTRSDISPLVAMWQAMDVHPGETIYTCLPLFHGNPLGISVIGAIFLDAAIAVSERFSAGRFWDEVRAFEAVEFNHVGAVIPILLKSAERPDDADNPVRVVLSAGCPPDAWEPFEQRFGVRIVEQFSMVDAPGYLINLEGRVGSMGKPVAGCEAAILDDDGAAIEEPERVGELALRAAEGRTHYYLNRPDATDEAYRDGWFHTGDLARRDGEGYFYYAGRKTESMRRRGENVSAWEVENVVNTHPSVLESAAHGVPSPLGEDDVKIVVVPRPGATVDPAELVDFCAARMAAYAVPRYVEIRTELPKTPTQRPRYAELKAQGPTAGTWDREAPRD